MAWYAFSEANLTIDVEFGELVRVIVAGDVDDRSMSLLCDVLDAAIAFPGSGPIEIDTTGAQFRDEKVWPVLFVEQGRAAKHGRQFTIK